jgi:hypothetical protein
LNDEETFVSNALYEEALDFRVGRLGGAWISAPLMLARLTASLSEQG